MTQETLTHLLVAAGGNGATQRIIDELKKDGMAVSAATADSRQELANLIKQPQWEAVICFEDSKISVPVVSDLVAQNSQPLPLILATSADKVVELLPMLEQGVADVVPVEQAKRLFLSVQRETVNSRLKRHVERLEKNHGELEEHYCAVLSNSASPISYVHDGTHLYSNQSYAALFGYESSEAITGGSFLDLIQVHDHSVVNTVMTQSPPKEEALAIRVVHRDGSESDMMLTFTPAEFQQRVCMKVTGRPLMSAAEAKSRPTHAAPNDTLGSLATDAQFLEQFEAAIRTALQKGVFSSLLIIAVHDSVQVQSEDEKARLNLLISDVTRFLRDYFQKHFTAARLDDHVFGFILLDADTDEIAALNALIKSSSNKHFGSAGPAPGEPVCTVGNTMINGREQKLEYVLAQASRHLKPAQLDKIKQNMMKGRPDISNADLLEYLMIAITQKRFKLLYQPIVHIKGSNHKGYEVLSRMLDGDGNEILPEAFIRLANQNGIGEKLDKLIITMVMDAHEKSAKSGPLIINISNNTLMSRTFLPWLHKQLEKRKIPAGLFAIAVSETEIHNNEGHAIDFCSGLSAAGVKLVISHFGCTLDPYTILDQIKPDLIKLDTSLLKEISKRATQRTTVQTTVGNLHTRGLLVVAPQVESLAILPILWDIGIDYVQGYALQAPSHEMNYNFLVEEEITLSAGRI